MILSTEEHASLEKSARAGDDGARLALGNQLLSAHRYGSSEHERGLSLLEQAARGPHAVQAQWCLGAYFSQVTVRPDAYASAAYWLALAANAGFVPAMERLADLHLLGAGVDRSPRQALHWYARMADLGVPQAAWNIGYLQSQGAAGEADASAAATAFVRGCALGYPPAYYSLGLRFALGAGVARDGGFARALLLRAADAGFPDARPAADELVPEEEFASSAPKWYARLKANLDTARLDQPHSNSSAENAGISSAYVSGLESHFHEIDHPAMQLDAAGRLRCVPDGMGTLQARPDDWNWLCQQPRIGLARRFATREECAHLVNKTAMSLRQASEYRRSSSANDNAEVLYFSGRGQTIGAMQADPVVRLLDQRIAGMTGWAVDALEPCSVIRYLPGEEYRPHVDFFSKEQIALNRAEGRDFGGQRIASFLLYLRVPESGGETVYEHPGLAVKGEPGMGVLHYNVTVDGSPDEQTLHCGRAVQRGEKWLWRSTLRARCLYRPDG